MASWTINVGDLVWFDPHSFDDPPEPYDMRNGKFAVLVRIIPSRVAGDAIAVVEDLHYGVRTRGGPHTTSTSRLYKAHWTFIGPVCLEWWPRYPMWFVGA